MDPCNTLSQRFFPEDNKIEVNAVVSDQVIPPNTRTVTGADASTALIASIIPDSNDPCQELNKSARKQKMATKAIVN